MSMSPYFLSNSSFLIGLIGALIGASAVFIVEYTHWRFEDLLGRENIIKGTQQYLNLKKETLEELKQETITFQTFAKIWAENLSRFNEEPAALKVIFNFFDRPINHAPSDGTLNDCLDNLEKMLTSLERKKVRFENCLILALGIAYLFILAVFFLSSLLLGLLIVAISIIVLLALGKCWLSLKGTEYLPFGVVYLLVFAVFFYFSFWLGIIVVVISLIYLISERNRLMEFFNFE
jgi:hypothetical protein